MEIHQEIECIWDLLLVLKGDSANLNTKIDVINDTINKLVADVQQMETRAKKMETRTLSGDDQIIMIEKLETIIKTLTGDDGK